MDKKLIDLYNYYGIRENAAPGAVGDKLGDAYEDYCIFIFENREYLDAFKRGYDSYDQEEGYQIFLSLMHKVNLCIINNNIKQIKATKNIPMRSTSGNPKTDVLITVFFEDNSIKEIPISVKQSTVPKVAFAEFDTITIVNEVGITDYNIKRLLTKHQTDASAKNFTQEEKEELKKLLEPIKEKFVRWVITGTANESSTDIRFPKFIQKFELTKGTFKLKSFHTYSVKEYIDYTLYNNGKPKTGGFGTGLAWTYATGSKGKKIQFKG